MHSGVPHPLTHPYRHSAPSPIGVTINFGGLPYEPAATSLLGGGIARRAAAHNDDAPRHVLRGTRAWRRSFEFFVNV